MKLILPLLAFMLFSIVFSGCVSDLSPDTPKDGEGSVEAVRLNFESNAVDLQDIDFAFSAGVPRTATKSQVNSIIKPLWKKIKVFKDSRFTIYELPISGDLKAFSLTKTYRDSVPEQTIGQIVSKLIVKCNNSTGECIYYIATMTGKNEGSDNRLIDYTHNKSFTGFIFISTLEGRCVGVYKCHAGARRRLGLNFVKKSSLDTVPEKSRGTTVQLYQASAMSYDNGECIAEICYRCTELGVPCEQCEFCYQDLGEVVVYPMCDVCNYQKSFCKCCPVCKEYPCHCYVDYLCYNCGSYFCNGECRYNCSYCGQSGCDGSCRGGGGGGYPTDPQPDDRCYDTVCTKCGNCKNPSKSTCSRCTCCTHEICSGCSKPIRPATRAAYACSHTEYCSSSGPVCDCGERHVDPVTKYPKCRELKGMLLDNSGNVAYSDMWNWSVENRKECGGYLLHSGKVLVYFYAKNKFDRSFTGAIAVCKPEGKMYTFSLDTLTIQPQSPLECLITESVHTHPSAHVRFDSIADNKIKAAYLAVSPEDMDAFSVNGLSSGLILSKKTTGGDGYVFRYYPGVLEREGDCPIVDRFK